MTSTSSLKQRTKINAALSFLYGSGHDVHAVTREAQTYISIGHGMLSAYEKAFATFVGSNPDTLAPLTRITALIEASDGATVVKYDRALSEYIETGNDASLNALAPMVAADMAALNFDEPDSDEESVVPAEPAGVWGPTGYSTAKAGARWQEAGKIVELNAVAAPSQGPL